MMPNLGQGGCQSTEDGYRLGQELGSVQRSPPHTHTLTHMHARTHAHARA